MKIGFSSNSYNYNIISRQILQNAVFSTIITTFLRYHRLNIFVMKKKKNVFRWMGPQIAVKNNGTYFWYIRIFESCFWFFWRNYNNSLGRSLCLRGKVDRPFSGSWDHLLSLLQGNSRGLWNVKHSVSSYLRGRRGSRHFWWGVVMIFTKGVVTTKTCSFPHWATPKIQNNELKALSQTLNERGGKVTRKIIISVGSEASLVWSPPRSSPDAGHNNCCISAEGASIAMH